MTTNHFHLPELLRLIIVITVLFSLNNNIFGQTKNDSKLIKEAVLNYLEGLEYNDTLKVEKALHPDLAKRVITKDKSGQDKLYNMTA